MLPPKSQYQIQKTVVPTKNQGKEKGDKSSACKKSTKGRVVRFRSICEEFEVTPSRESSPVCETEKEHLPGGSDLFKQILKDYYCSDESAEDSAFSEAEGVSAASTAKPKKSILKRREVSRFCRQKGKRKT